MNIVNSKTRRNSESSIAGFPMGVIGLSNYSGNFIDYTIVNQNPKLCLLKGSHTSYSKLVDIKPRCSSSSIIGGEIVSQIRKYPQNAYTGILSSLDKVYSSIELSQIESFYSLVNSLEIKEFLVSNKSLYSVLINAIHVITMLGNETYASLELYKFIDDGIKTLFLNIHSKQDLTSFEEEIIDNILSYSADVDGKVAINFVQH